jgi:hypothetical protein
MSTPVGREALPLDLKKFISDWQWESHYGSALFNADYPHRREALLKFAEDLRAALVAAGGPQQPTSEKWQRLYNVITALGPAHGTNDLVDEGHDLIRELRAAGIAERSKESA